MDVAMAFAAVIDGLALHTRVTSHVDNVTAERLAKELHPGSARSSTLTAPTLGMSGSGGRAAPCRGTAVPHAAGRRDRVGRAAIVRLIRTPHPPQVRPRPLGPARYPISPAGDGEPGGQLQR